MKSYNIKLYSLAGSYVRTFSPNEVMSEVQFSAQTDGWQGELRLKLSYSYNTTNISTGSIIKVFAVDENNPTGRQIYVGFVGSIVRISDKSTEYIEARVVGIASMFSWILYKNGANYAFSKTDDPANIAKEIADTMNAQYPWLVSYDASSVQNYGSSLTISFSYEKCLDSLKKTVALTDYWWTISGTGKLYFQPKSAGTTHYLTFGKDIDSIEIEENSEKIVNEYFLDYASWTVSASDSASQTAYGKRQLKDSKTDIGNSWTANIAATEYITLNKDPKKRIVLSVNSRYDFESMKPWDLVTVRNLEYQIAWLQILRMEYSPNAIRIELDSVRSFQKEIFTT